MSSVYQTVLAAFCRLFRAARTPNDSINGAEQAPAESVEYNGAERERLSIEAVRTGSHNSIDMHLVKSIYRSP